MKNIPIGQLLLENNLITLEQLNDALAKQKMNPGKRLGDALVDLGYIKEKDMLKVLSKRLNVPYIENPMFSVSLDAVNLVPEELLRKNQVVPMSVKDGVLTVATSDPLDFYGLEDIRLATHMDVECMISSKQEIMRTLDKIFSRINTNEAVDTLNREYDDSTVQAGMANNAELMERIDSAPIVKLLNTLISEAIQLNASDIHIEPEEEQTQVRLRVDGDLREHITLQTTVHPLLITRIKILSGMNIAEKRIPQDGRFKFQHGLMEIDMRVSSLPTLYGEKIVMRLLGTNQDVSYDFEDMGFSPESINEISDMLNYTNGIILATGPTGSGKTTTLYTMLEKINNSKCNIVTVEDPVEKRIEHVNQVQVNTKAGLTFASGLRSILRQDPDIIMIGEIRDGETAEIAIRAAITGHLVLSTLHTNDSFSAIARLVDMGAEPYMLATSIRGIIAQRLVKRICPYCRQAVAITDKEKTLLKTDKIETVYRGAGCQHCGQTGYRGRISINEVLRIDREMQKIITRQDADAQLMREHAEAGKMRTMREEILELVRDGVTTAEEAVKVLYSIE